MRWFIVVAAAATIAFGVATYRPVQVCEQISADTAVSCQNGTCIATTYNANRICHWKN